jgi:hypothetical protein
MISHASFQEQVIDELQAFVALTALVPAAEIREMQWQGVDFTYPAVRVDTRRQIPEGTAPCRLTISIEDFAVLAYSEDDSSLECEQICFQIIEALFSSRTQLEDATPSQGPAWRTETVNLVTFNAPRRMGERTWRGEVIFRCRVKETS